MEYSADVAKIDMRLRPLFKSAPRTSPRKNASSISGTTAAAATPLATPGQLIPPRRDKIGVASRIEPQHTSRIGDKAKPEVKYRARSGFGLSCKSFRLRTLSDRISGQSKMAAAISSAR